MQGIYLFVLAVVASGLPPSSQSDNSSLFRPALTWADTPGADRLSAADCSVGSGPAVVILSRIFDAGQDSALGRATCSWVAKEPAGAAVRLKVRSGNTPEPGPTWTPFCPIASSGDSLPARIAANRYLQYQALLSYSLIELLPELESVRFELAPTLAVDVGVTRILAPAGTMDSAVVTTPRVEVRNYESSSPSVRATLRIGTGYLRTVTRTVLPLATDTFSFPAWTALPIGRHTVRCSLYAADDNNPANDTASDTVRVRVNSDVGPTAILVPPAACESGTVFVPMATARNYGQRPEVFPIAIEIGADYLETVYDTLNSGQTDTVSFPAWTAEPKGLLDVRCFTSLASDINRANDTVTQTTNVYTGVDAATLAILAPTDSIDSGTTVTPRARVANLGTSPATIPARMTIGAAYSQTASVLVQPGETATVSFLSWVATPLGTQAVRCSTYLVGDTVPANDLQTDSVTVVTRKDASSVAILSPVGNVDSGTVMTPVCRIANNGTSAALVPARLRIGSGYDQTVSKLLAPGTQDTVRFPSWTASPLGTLSVRCTTSLFGDEDPLNDTVSAAVNVGVSIDAQAQAILAPAGMVESGAVVTPVCRIRNLSTSQKTIPVTMRIGSAYEQTRAKFLSAGVSDTVGFPAWAASPVGRQNIRCSTSLAGDTFRMNDTVSGSVLVTATIDAATIAILAPVDTVDSGTIITPQARIANLGRNTALIPARMTIGSGYADTVAASVNPGETLTVSFADWIASPLGTHAVQCSTMLAGDTLNTNDARSGTVTVVAHIDAQAVAIVTPAGLIDSGTTVTPVCRIANGGTSGALIPVRLRIGSGYEQTVAKFLAAGAQDTVQFPNWTAAPVGPLAVQCSTALTGDEQPTNDTVSSWIYVGTRIDAAAMAIVVPTGTLDSGTVVTPVCSIICLSTSPKLVPARLRIGGSYSQTRTKFMLPGESDTFRFPDWTASPVGILAVQCSTTLAGDTFPDNDTANGTVTVITAPILDAELTAILSPNGTLDSGTSVTPTVVVTNRGNRLSAIPVRMSIGTGYVQFDTISVSAGASETLDFPAWAAQPVGLVSVVANTYLSGDEYPTNDTARRTVTVVRHIDAAAVNIVAPVGDVDSGTTIAPRAMVANEGTSTAAIPVRLTIGTGYVGVETVSVAPRETLQVVFADWTAGPLGTMAVRCSTGLAGDEDTSNDTTSVNVRVRRPMVLDVGVVEILSPPDTVDTASTHVPAAIVRNFGNRDTFFPVTFRINGTWERSVVETLGAGATDTVRFPLWAAAPCGTLPIACFTALDGDAGPDNDTAYDAVTVRPIVDAAALAVLAPTGTLDSGTAVAPAIEIRNNGTRSQAIPVRMAVGASYEQFDTVAVSAGGTDTVFFPAWTAQPVGTHQAVANTYLSGDRDPSNDTARATVTVIRHIDAASVSIRAPAGSIDSGTVVTPSARVTNNGTSTASVPVRLTIGSAYAESISVNVSPHETLAVDFPDWTAMPVGLLGVRCSTGLTGDEDPTNDTVSSSVRVVTAIDAATIFIVAPTDTTDSGTVITPQARIANLGRNTALIPARMTIGSGYADTVAASVNPGETLTVSFADWVASPLGTHAVQCSTMLAGDTFPDNDTANGTVTVIPAPFLDAELTAILSPNGTLDSGAMATPTVRVRNNGTRTAVIPIRVAIGSAYVEYDTVALAPGASDTRFLPEWFATPVGVVQITANTYLSGDEYPANDTARATVTVIRHIDAASVSIVTPSGSVDSGTVLAPRARVANNGTSTASVPVRLTIGSAYAESVSVNVSPHETLAVNFPDWTAMPVGLLGIRCSTGLASDENSANDTVSGSVFVTRPVILDVGVTTILAPSDTVDSGTAETPSAIVRNFGNRDTFFPVTFRIGSLWSRTLSETLAAGGTDTISFPSWTAQPCSTLAITCFTTLTGDRTPGNDTAYGSVTVRPIIDAAAVAIIAPAGTLDSGTTVTPAVSAANLGSHAAQIPVRLVIGTGYADTALLTLAPGQTDTFFFDTWTASPVGVSAIRCSTVLAGDRQPTNDTLSNSVTVIRRIDAASVRIVAPVGNVDSGTIIAPRAMVTNNGTSAAAIPVRLTIGTDYTDVETVSVSPRETSQVTFADWTAEPEGLLAIRCSTGLAGDEQPANDTVRSQVNVVVDRDAALISILAPTGTIDSGVSITPQAVISNLGSGSASVPAILRIGTLYTDTVQTTLAPGQQDTVSFNPWSASPVGNLPVRCSTALVGDTNPINDTVSTLVTVRLKVDAAALVVLSPTGTLDSGTIIVPICSIANYSSRTQLVRARLRIGPVYNQTRAKFMAPGQVDTFRFQQWTASPVGFVSVRCSTRLAGDQYPANDTANATVLVVRRIDAGVTAILAPAGYLDSGTVVTPVCRIQNLSTSTKAVPVEMRIGAGYTATASKSLAPGATDTVRFTDWAASPLGTLAVRCTTRLAGDENPLNDTLTGSVVVGTQANAAALAILSPIGSVDSGSVITPVCSIANYSTSAKAVPVTLTIGSLYSDSRAKLLAPGQADTVSFTNWTATPLGVQTVVCSTALAGDTVPGDDRVADSVVVTSTIDAAAIAILVPPDTVDSGATLSPQAVVSNLGTSQALVPVTFSIGSGYAATDTILLAALASDTVAFPSWPAVAVGSFAMVCSTGLAGDQDPLNDTVRRTVTVRAVIDAASVAIIAPAGILDSGTTVTPAAVVTNNSSHTQDIPVVLSVGAGYRDTTIVSIAPAQSDTVTFADWLASPPGTWTVRCSTALAGDRVPANDTVSAPVQVRRVIDASIAAIIAPTGSLDSGTAVVPRALVANLGTVTALIPVTMHIGSTYEQSDEVILGPGQSDTMSFPAWTASPFGWQTVRCSSALAGDMNEANNQAVDSVLVGARIDAAALVILAPAGTVDSGTAVMPACLVANYSTSPTVVPVRMEIGAAYSDTTSILVLPGATDTARFSNWAAGPVGLWPVRCSVALPGDTFPDNDTASGQVNVAELVDAASIAIIAPNGLLDSGAVITPTCVIRNNGTASAEVPVRLTIGSGYSDTCTRSLAPGAADTVVFTDWTAEPSGTLTVRCSTSLSGDNHPENDTLSTSVTVRAVIDAASVAILAPLGSIDSGTVVTPQAQVTNNGASPALIPVRMDIGSAYAESVSVSTRPGETLVVNLPDWTAQPVGLLSVRCSTGLTGDQHPENDTLSSTVQVGRRIDAAVSAILAPVGAVDSGAMVTPLAVVANIGTSSALIPVSFFIGAGYGESTSVAVGPGQSDTVSFPAWTASGLGWNPVRCTVGLAGDTNPANDQLSDSVFVGLKIDAAALTIIAPTGLVDSGRPITPVCSIANYSTSPKAIPVRLSIGVTYVESTSKFLAPGASDTVGFPAWTAEPLGPAAVRCSTYLAGDTIPDNDTVSALVLVTAWVDAGVTAILAPLGTIDSGAMVIPVARIVNNSLSPKLVPVRLTIGSLYSDSQARFLAPRQEDTVQFAAWTADQVGTHAVRCSTSLLGDEDPANDTMSSSVSVRVRLDAAVLQVLAPTGTVDSGSVTAPQAIVANYSVRKVAIPIHLLVTDGYHESLAVAIDAGASRAITFPDWGALAVGTFTVTCSTALTGDIAPDNDTLHGSVTVTNRHDVGCYLVVAPAGTVDSGTTITPKAMVANFGPGPESVPVQMTIAGGYSDLRQVGVGPGESLLVSFASWTASPVGLLSVRCSTRLASDTTSSNDAASESVQVVTHPDVAVTDIYAPLGPCDSGTVITPYARVCNYGSAPVTFPVRLRIGASYDQARDKYLGVGAKDTVNFPDWVAAPLGIQGVVCSTALSGDTNSANDCKTDSVSVTAHRDGAVLAVLAPTGTIDSGSYVSPLALVANYGTSSGFIPVRLSLPGGYDSLATKFIAAGAADTVKFPDWLASPLGIQYARCSTEVTGDREHGNDAATDSVLVRVTRDASCVEIQSPQGVLDSAQVVTPVALIANYSTSAQEVPVLLRIGSDYAKSRRKWLTPGQQDTLVFPDWSAHPVGIVTMACSTALWDDNRLKNDAARSQILVQNVQDAGVDEIIVPIGMVDSGRQILPKVWVRNHGLYPLAVPVQMRIGDFYISTRTKLMAPGASDTVQFDPWTAEQVGRHAVRCSTTINPDANPANDYKDAWADVEWLDAGCIRIVAPVGPVPADTIIQPRAMVRNLGTRPTRIPAVFRAGPLYACLTISDSVTPGDSVELTFPPLTVPTGEMAVSCSTALLTDMRPTNDKLTATTFGANRVIVLEPDSFLEADPGATVTYVLTCTNNGNAEDTIDITHRHTREGWQVEFYDSTGAELLTDHNQNCMPDLGPVPVAASVRFRVRITVPANAPGLSEDSTEVRASSGANFVISDQARLVTRVKPMANLLIEPDGFGTAAPGQQRLYTLTIRNLGNVADHADLGLFGSGLGWHHQLLDAGGKSLGDKNHNGRRDLGPVQPFGGTAELTLAVTVARNARLGSQDTAVIDIQSFVADSVRDSVRVITEACGAVTALAVEPDQTGAVALGQTEDFRLWVQTAGNVDGIVNVTAASSLSGWESKLYHDDATRELADSDFDGLPDLGLVSPGTRANFVLRITAPAVGDLTGDIDSLLTTWVKVVATLSGEAAISDSAVVRVTAVPRFEVHNTANPFSDRTRFMLSIPRPGRVTLTVYSRLGEVVRSLIDDQPYPTGVYSLEWDGTNSAGRKLAPGIYVYMLELTPATGSPQRTVKKAVIKR